MTKRMLRVFKRVRAPGGNVVWTVDGHSYYWNGPGARLHLMFGDQLVSVDHPSASGSYETSREAEAAVRRFSGLPPAQSKKERASKRKRRKR